MQKPSVTSTQVLVTDPFTGRQYDFLPLFKLMDEQTLWMSDISNGMRESADALPGAVNEDNIQKYDELLYAFYLLADFSKVFGKIAESRVDPDHEGSSSQSA